MSMTAAATGKSILVTTLLSVRMTGAVEAKHLMRIKQRTCAAAAATVDDRHASLRVANTYPALLP